MEEKGDGVKGLSGELIFIIIVNLWWLNVRKKDYFEFEVFERIFWIC